MTLFRKTLIALTALTITGASITTFAMAEEMARKTLQEKLDDRKKAFSEKADPQKISDYEQGIKQVEESGVLERAKKTGDSAPDFTLPDSTGNNVTLSTLLEDGPVVMIWYRGEWCPYCNIYLAELQSQAEEFKKAGAQIVAISPETPEHAVSVADKLDLGYHVLSDEQSKIAEQYGVVYTVPPKIAAYLQEAFDLHSANNDDRNILPLAASYVIGQDGVISYAFLNADYRERADTAILLDEVNKLSGGESQ